MARINIALSQIGTKVFVTQMLFNGDKAIESSETIHDFPTQAEAEAGMARVMALALKMQEKS